MAAKQPIDALSVWGEMAILPYIIHTRDPLIVVIGNGPLLQKVPEHIMQEASVVIRFNNWMTRKGSHSVEMSGERCDILFSNMDVHNTCGAPPGQVVMALPYPHHADDAPRLLHAFYRNSGAYMVNPWWMHELYSEIECPYPTVGMTALYCLHKIDLQVPVKVYGFNWHFDPRERTIQGMSLEAEHQNAAWRHRYPMECRWVSQHLYGHPFWDFTEDAQTALEAVNERVWPWVFNDPA